MTESILNTIKQMLGIPVTDTAFDQDIIVNINSAFMVLNQLGVGPEAVYSIQDSTAVWTGFTTDIATYSAVKTYIYLKVRLVFDAPGTSFHLDSIKNQILELEWRLMVQVPIPPEPVVPPEEP
jgi:hypothetical protein